MSRSTRPHPPDQPWITATIRLPVIPEAARSRPCARPIFVRWTTSEKCRTRERAYLVRRDLIRCSIHVRYKGQIQGSFQGRPPARRFGWSEVDQYHVRSHRRPHQKSCLPKERLICQRPVKSLIWSSTVRACSLSGTDAQPPGRPVARARYESQHCRPGAPTQFGLQCRALTHGKRICLGAVLIPI